MKYFKNNYMIWLMTILVFIITFFLDIYTNIKIDDYVLNKTVLFISLLLIWHVIFYLSKKGLFRHLIVVFIPIVILLLILNSNANLLYFNTYMLIPVKELIIFVQAFILGLIISYIIFVFNKIIVNILLLITMIVLLLIYKDYTIYPVISIYYIVIITLVKWLVKKNNRVVFISSTGGHLEELLQLKPTMDKYDYYIITEKTETNETLKNKFEDRVGYLVYGTRKNLIKYAFVMAINLYRSFMFYLKVKPNVIVTTGTHTAVMMCYIGKFFGSKVVYIETFANRETKTLAGRLIYPIADKFIVQWKEMLKKYPKAEYFGGVY